MCWPTMSELNVRRVYTHPAERVFDAFARPDQLARWLAPGPDFETCVEHFDFRLGGGFRLSFVLPAHPASVLTGSYKHLSPPDRLAFSWQWLAPDPHAGVLSEVDVRFESHPLGTLLTLTHGRLDALGMKQRHSEVWPIVLERLNALLESP